MVNRRIDISDLASLAGVSTRVIRHYVLIGLINACEDMASGRIRSFDRSVLGELEDILALKQLGYSLIEIGVILKKPLKEAVDFRLDPKCRNRHELIEDLGAKAEVIRFLIQKFSK